MSIQTFAQKDKLENLPNFDRRWYHFGFAIGINSADFYMAPDIGLVDSLYGIETLRQAAFNLGIIGAWHFMPSWSLRFVPTLVFAQRNLQYRFLQPTGQIKPRVKKIESTYIDFPLLLKYRSTRMNNFAAYVLGGAKYSLDLASQQHVDNSNSNDETVVVKLKQNTFSAEIGGGLDFFMEYFKFGLELKYSIGLHNAAIDDGTTFSTPLNNRVFPTMWIISVNFEG